MEVGHRRTVVTSIVQYQFFETNPTPKSFSKSGRLDDKIADILWTLSFIGDPRNISVIQGTIDIGWEFGFSNIPNIHIVRTIFHYLEVDVEISRIWV